jgi:aryl-alcohol dehydrogenase-like predicted oxidoreductase
MELEMELRNLGRAGLRVSAVGLGCNNFGGRIGLEETRAVVHKAIDLGITLFDTADAYGNRGGSEESLGQILGERRKDIVLATKFGLPMDDAKTLSGASRRYIMTAVEASLRRLRTDWIDLYQVHQPDPLTPIEETLRALDDLVRQGKVLYVGSSNFTAAQVVEADRTAHDLKLSTFISCQNQYSLLKRDIEAELVPAMQARGLGLLPYFPLAGGLLTGKYRRDTPPPAGTRFARAASRSDRFLNPANWATVERLQDFCARRGHALLELAFSWLAARPYVASVIAGATKPGQVEQNVKAASWRLTQEDLLEIDRLTGALNPSP